MKKSTKKVKVNSSEEAEKFLEKAYNLGYKWKYKRHDVSRKNIRFFVLDKNEELGYFAKEENFAKATSIEEISLEYFLNYG